VAKTRSKFPILAVSAIALAAGGIGAYFAFKPLTSGEVSPLAAAKLVPDEALMAAYISTDPQVWGKLEQFGTPEAQTLLRKWVQSYNQQLTANKLSYENDLKSWVGDVMIAVLPSDSLQPVQNRVSNSPNPPNILAVVSVKDKPRALDFANKLKADNTQQLKEVGYKDQKILEAMSDGKPTYSAILNDHVVVSDQRQVVEQAIDTFKGEASFANKAGARDILVQGVKVQNPLLQVYLPDYAGLVKQSLAGNPQASQLSPETLKQLGQLKSVVAGIGVDQVGLRMQAIATLDPQTIQWQAQPAAGEIISRFPADTMLMITGQGLSRSWSAFVQQAQSNPDLKRGLDMARGGFQMLNLDLDQDIFGWMDGEFGFAVIPVDQGLLASFGAGGAMVWDTRDRKAAEAAFTKLDNLAKSRFVNVTQGTIGGKTLTTWQTPAGTLLAHGWLDQDTVLVALSEPVAEAIATPPASQLDRSETFKVMTDTLPKPNSGYFYLDMNRIMAVLERSPQAQSQPISPEAKAILNSIQGIGATATSPNKTTGQMEMVLALKPKSAN
jgi:hypothetical protein